MLHTSVKCSNPVQIYKTSRKNHCVHLLLLLPYRCEDPKTHEDPSQTSKLWLSPLAQLGPLLTTFDRSPRSLPHLPLRVHVPKSLRPIPAFPTARSSDVLIVQHDSRSCMKVDHMTLNSRKHKFYISMIWRECRESPAVDHYMSRYIVTERAFVCQWCRPRINVK